MTPVWLVVGSLSLGLPKAVLRVLVPLKCTWMPFAFTYSFEFFSCFVDVWHYNGCFVLVVAGRVAVVVVGTGWPCWLWGLGEFVFPLVQCPRGELAAWRAVLMWESSLSKFCWVEDTVLALCARVL